MSRSGYTDDCDDLDGWRTAVDKAAASPAGQRFFRDLVAGLDAMPNKRLIVGTLQTKDGEVCAFGAVAQQRKVDVSDIKFADPDNDDDMDENYEAIDALCNRFDVMDELARETVYVNDEAGPHDQTPEARWKRVRNWAAGNLETSNG